MPASSPKEERAARKKSPATVFDRTFGAVSNISTQEWSRIAVISSDGEIPTCLINYAAAAYDLDIPFNGPVAAVRINKAGGQFVINPTWRGRNRSLNCHLRHAAGAT